MTCTRSRCCHGSASASPGPQNPIAISPSRSACIRTRRRSRRCSSRRASRRSKYSTSPPAWSPCIAVFDFDSMVELEVSIMGKWLLGICIAITSATLVATEADAARLGGGRSVGAQRNVTPAPAKPAQQQAAPKPTQPAQPAQQGSRWGMLGGILGGLALGGLLGYLFGGSGILGLLLVALLAIAAVIGIRALMRRRTEEPARPMQLAGLGNETMAPPQPVSGSLPATSATSVPAGFDTAGFPRAAKMNLIQLQVANGSSGWLLAGIQQMH